MKRGPTDPELSHSMSLLREIPGWDGRVAMVPIDAVCLWDGGEGPCEGALGKASVLLVKNADGEFSAHVLVLCDHHANCMEAGVAKWKAMS